jgi:hypothetical protein
MARYPILLALARFLRILEKARFSPRIGHIGRMASAPVEKCRWVGWARADGLDYCVSTYEPAIVQPKFGLTNDVA